MYAQHRVVLVETRDPKGGHEVTGRHVDEIERRVRGKPLRSSATSAIDGPLTRQVRNRAYLFGCPSFPRKLQNPPCTWAFVDFFGSDGAFHYVAPVFLCGIR
jgi:hypothetical protein